MEKSLEQAVREVCQASGNDRTRLMDIVRAVQGQFGCVSDESMDFIANEVGVKRVLVEGVVSFYAFLSDDPKGKIVIRLCDDIIDMMKGSERVGAAFEEALGIKFGETTSDGLVTLEYAPCIGMCDQAPAALVNDVFVTNLSTDDARTIVDMLRKTGDPQKLVTKLGDGINGHELVQSMVQNNIRKSGPVIFAPLDKGAAIKKAVAMSPNEVIRDVKTARLRGRGGAGFPTGMKWDFTRSADNGGKPRFIICNADEGEPGTFKDRAILTEAADLMFEGMTIGGYAVGAVHGIVYLRAEYAYLQNYLESVLAARREAGLLGENIVGKEGFSFDIRIQMGAGAYICGEETALISSCEGLRGDPKNRPPFPAQKGYLEAPTSVNNVETFCCVARVLDQGPGWFAQLGNEKSSGTKLLSVSGDCKSPGVYEVEFGMTLKEMLDMVGAEDAAAVQVGGPSGQMVGVADFGREICYDDLATGGSMMVFGPERNVVEVAAEFMKFFCEESCGYCTPCRVGNVLLKERLDVVLAGKGTPEDLDYLKELGETVKFASRCGLGQTSANPVLTTLKNFRSAYEALVKAPAEEGMQPTFDIGAALSDASRVQGRESVHFGK